MSNPEWDNHKTKDGIDLITAERKRQVRELGWTSDHDDEHQREELAWAATHYAAPEGLIRSVGGGFSRVWPDTWSKSWDKKGEGTRIRDLVKAGALIAAEIDRLLRAEKRTSTVQVTDLSKSLQVLDGLTGELLRSLRESSEEEVERLVEKLSTDLEKDDMRTIGRLSSVLIELFEELLMHGFRSK